tara:strand:+ start:551 stop:946 length:396 start_codon:yes stop_codon:yes gene_type:complete
MEKNKYSKAELKKFRTSIQKKIKDINSEMDELKDGMGQSSKGNGSLSQDSVYSVHMADAGTDSYEMEKGYQLMNRETNYLQHLDLAIERIDNGDFGVCKICNQLIPEERMMEVPNATKCVSCKEKQKLNLL